MIDLTNAPQRIVSLPRDQRGFPVPWFVNRAQPWDFRVLRSNAAEEAVSRNVCWICGGPLGQFKSLVLGPLTAIQRMSSEPSCHRECAEFAVIVCPYIANPRMTRNSKDFVVETEQIKNMALENPGVFCVWTTRKCTYIRDGAGKFVIKPGDPSSVQWFKERRLATKGEVADAFDMMLPKLAAVASPERIEAMIRNIRSYLP